MPCCNRRASVWLPSSKGPGGASNTSNVSLGLIGAAAKHRRVRGFLQSLASRYSAHQIDHTLPGQATSIPRHTPANPGATRPARPGAKPKSCPARGSSPAAAHDHQKIDRLTISLVALAAQHAELVECAHGTLSNAALPSATITIAKPDRRDTGAGHAQPQPGPRAQQQQAPHRPMPACTARCGLPSSPQPVNVRRQTPASRREGSARYGGTCRHPPSRWLGRCGHAPSPAATSSAGDQRHQHDDRGSADRWRHSETASSGAQQRPPGTCPASTLHAPTLECRRPATPSPVSRGGAGPGKARAPT